MSLFYMISMVPTEEVVSLLVLWPSTMAFAVIGFSGTTCFTISGLI